MTLTKEINDKKVNFEFNKDFINLFSKKIKENHTNFLNRTLKELHPSDSADIIENLIPDNGRSLKCSSCKHIWHYKTRVNNDPEDLRLAEDQINKINIESTDVYNEEENNETIDEVLSKEKIDNTEVKAENGKIKGEKNKNIKMIITYFIVLIISLLGFIILLDTFNA